MGSPIYPKDIREDSMELETMSNLIASGLIVPSLGALKRLVPRLSQIPVLVFGVAFGMAVALSYGASMAHEALTWWSPEHIQASTWMALMAIGIKTGWKTVQKHRKLPGEK